MARKLYHVPAWHNRVDWNIDDPLDQNSLTSYMRTMPEWFWQVAEIYWDIVHEAVRRLHILDWKKVACFSDSTWEASIEEEKFVRALAKEGSRHMQVVVYLLDSGARQEVTEDASLFIGKSTEDSYTAPLEIRDAAIASNINRRLQDGEIGFLILGMDHKSWQQHLDPDILIETILNEDDLKKFPNKEKAV